MKDLHATLSLTTAWTTISPTFVINYFSIYAINSDIEFSFLDSSGWSTPETITTPNITEGFTDCLNIRFRAKSGTANITYSLQGRYIFINEYDAKVTPHNDDYLLLADSEEGYKKKKVKISAIGGGGGVTVHNNLTGIQGGLAGEYYHLTATEASYIDQSVISGSTPTFGITNFTGTLGAFICTPSSAPITDYEVANKKYVDDNAGGAGGASTFVDLTDTPANYTAAGGKFVRVNATPDALEFISLTANLIGAGALDIGANTLTVNSIEIVGADGEVNKAAVEDSGNWDSAYSAMHTQGTDQTLDLGGVSEVSVADVKDAVDKKHTKLHGIEAITDHNGVSGAVENNFISFNANGLPKDSGQKDSDYLKNIVEDTTPQLGGDLDTQGNDIVNGLDIVLQDDGAGILSFPNQSFVSAFSLSPQITPTNTNLVVNYNTVGTDRQNEYNNTQVSGTADATEAYKLHDADGGFSAALVGATLWNTTDNTYTIITGFVDSGELDLNDNIMVNGENYLIYYSRYTATREGVYLVTSSNEYLSFGDGATCQVSILLNGVQARVIQAQAASTGRMAAQVTAALSLIAGDYIEIQVRQATGVNRTLNGLSARTYFSITKEG